MKQTAQKLTISKDEIRACYAQGEEAVVALVESLVRRINALEARIEVLENQKSKDSKNSSKPPSADGFGRVNAPKWGVLRSIKTRIANLISTYQLVTIMTILTETKIKYEIVLI